MKYLSPTSLPAALAACADGSLRVISGGTDCYAEAAMVPCSHGWLDISRIDALRGISATGDWIRIGATTPWALIAEDTNGLVPAALKQAARIIGSRQIQARGTIGGNVCHAAPAADGLPPLLALDARVELASARAIRDVPLTDFLRGRRTTALGSNELLTCVKVPRPLPNEETAFYKFGNRRGMTIAVVSAAVLLRWTARQEVGEARIVIGCASEMPVRAASVESQLVGRRKGQIAPLLAAADIEEISPIDDLRASAQFRRKLASVVAARACLRIEKGLEDVEHIV